MKTTLALTNGKIYTMNGQQVEALAISGESIIKVGSTAEVSKLIDSNTAIIDLDGKAVIPGFNDTHVHLVGYGRSINAVDLNDVTSIDELIARCRQFIQDKNIQPGEWVYGRGWNQNLFDINKVFPTKKDLDQISTKHPILLIRVCGHIGLANTMALKNVGVTKDTFLEGGSFDKDEQQELNGVIREASLEWFKKNIYPKPSTEEIKRAILAGTKELLKYGVTSVHTEDSYDLGYGGAFEDIYNTYQTMVRNHELPIRVYQKISLPKKEDLEKFLKGSLRTGDGDTYYKIGPLKQWCDGTMGARTAALLEDYHDDPGNKGLMVYTKDELYNNVYLAHKENMQVCLHAIGDGALSMVLDVYERVLQELPRKNVRHRIVHCQVGNRALYEKLAKLGIVINIQPLSTASDLTMMNSRLGSEREKECHAWRTLQDLGVCISASSDIPVESPNAFYGIHAIVNRQHLDGNPAEGWLPEQSVTVKEAIEMYTINSAYAAFEDHIKGTLVEGKLADMIVLNQDPFEVNVDELKDIVVEKTIVGGKVRFSI
ncbi:amidohydrolase [Clostridiaceae bacterium 35-E11]